MKKFELVFKCFISKKLFTCLFKNRHMCIFETIHIEIYKNHFKYISKKYSSLYS